MHLKALIYFCKSVPSKFFGRVLNIFLTCFESKVLVSNSAYGAAQKKKFSIKDFFNKFDQMRRLLRIWSHLLKKSLMENFIFCAVCLSKMIRRILSKPVIHYMPYSVWKSQFCYVETTNWKWKCHCLHLLLCRWCHCAYP